MSTQAGLKKLREKYNKANGWRYAGGRRKRIETGINEYITQETPHSRYYENFIRPEWMSQGFCNAWYYPTRKPRCVCEHKISEQCYIYQRRNNTIKVRVIGNCCIRKFDLKGRHCSMCDAVHQNRSVNLCNECR